MSKNDENVLSVISGLGIIINHFLDQNFLCLVSMKSFLTSIYCVCSRKLYNLEQYFERYLNFKGYPEQQTCEIFHLELVKFSIIFW